MDVLLWIILGCLAIGVVLLVVVLLDARQNNVNLSRSIENLLQNELCTVRENSQTEEQLRHELRKEQEKNSSLRAENATLQERLTHIQNKLEDTIRAQEQEAELLQERFKVLSQDLLQENAKHLAHNNQEQMQLMLTPLKEQLDRYQQSLIRIDKEQLGSRSEMKEQIRLLVQQTEKIGHEARDLAQALKGNSKIQGDWGEQFLERLLELNGFRKGENYLVQHSIKASEHHGTLRPDFLLLLPEKRVVVIDSKVSLTAYQEYYNQEDSEKRALSLQAHVNSVRNHVSALEQKSYQDYIQDSYQVLDFVLLFIPISGALEAALEADSALWEDAYKKRVLLVSPVQILPVIKLLSDLWKMRKQQENVQEVIVRAGEIYDKLVGVWEAMQGTEKALGKAQESFETVQKRFQSGKWSLLDQFENLRQLGLTTKKRLPASDLSGTPLPPQSQTEETNDSSLPTQE